MKRLSTIALLLVGCLDVPEGPAPECRATTDCDSANGEVCEDGVCWGNPPEGMFAAVVAPPSDRKDLVPKEIRELQITESGWIAGLELERPITVSGAVEAVCPGTGACDRAIEATITVTRDSHFEGGPGFKTVVETDVSTEGSTYELRLPPPREGASDEERRDLPYTVTVVPKGRGDTEPLSPTAAMRVPPMWFQVAPADSTTTRTIQLGGTALGAVEGQILSSAYAGLPKYRVVALGRWEPGGPLTEVSTVAYTQSDGKFKLYLSDGLAEDVEIVARPFGGGIQPTLRMAGVSKDGATQLALIEPILAGLRDGRPARASIPPGEEEAVKRLQLLTSKPVLYVCNVEEASAGTGNAQSEKVFARAAAEGAKAVVVSAAIEAEISQMDEADRGEFLEGLGLSDSGLDRVIAAGYGLLGLLTYFTVGPKEARAWTITRGMKAPQAAGVIHGDFERGFIAAETIAYDDYVALGGEQGAKEAGKMRVEGKEYVVKDGDILLFRFNV